MDEDTEQGGGMDPVPSESLSKSKFYFLHAENK